jgi:hypothetical protein
MATKPKAAIDPDNKRDNNEAIWQILLNICGKQPLRKP